MSLINISNLTFAYDGSYDNIFENVSFQIDTDWKLGFVGRNGRGKTTFLKLLLGAYEYRGNISASVDFEYFPFEVPDLSRDTGEIVNGISPRHEPWELLRELSLLGVPEEALYRPFETLSNGERTKVLLAALFLRENSFLLIDEPTNHLDAEARGTVGEYLRSKKGFILVSHDRAFLDRCVDHILSINRTNIEIQKGDFSAWYRNKQMRDHFEFEEQEKLKKEIKRLDQSARRAAGWSDKTEKSKYGGDVPDRGFVGHKAAKMMKRAKSVQARRESAAEEKEKLLKNAETAESLKISPLFHHADRLVELRDVSVFYGEKAACTGVSFTVRRGDRIALRGKNGSGKSSVLKLLCGEALSFSGTLEKAPNLLISYVPQDTSFLKGNLADYAEKCGIDGDLFRAILRKLDFSRTQFEKDMAVFSGGQKKKVLIARSLCERAHLYLWDEPLNFIDIFSRMQIEELLLEHRPTLLFVEHDRVFAQAVATGSVEL